MSKNLVENLIDDAVITHAEFIEPCELTRQGFRLDGVQVRG
jgi:hypothetical protein